MNRKVKMCYSVVSLVSQSAQVPTGPGVHGTAVPSPPSAGLDSHGGSPHSTNGSTSGYASYASDMDYFENYDVDLEVKPFVDDQPPPLMHPRYSMGQQTPSPPDSVIYSGDHLERSSMLYGYPTNFLHDVDPMMYPPPYNTGDVSGFGIDTKPVYANKPFGSLTSTNFCISNYPQAAEGLSSPGDGSPSSLNHSLQHTICKVCGDTASGNHFGVLSCEACKSFFRRSVRANARYACRGNRTCAIEKNTRNRCQYCRMQKCASMGMRKEGESVEDFSVIYKFITSKVE